MPSGRRFSGNFFGFTPQEDKQEESESVLAGYFPELKLSYGLNKRKQGSPEYSPKLNLSAGIDKGERGGRLGYGSQDQQTTSTPTSTPTSTLTPTSTPTLTPTFTPPADTRRSLGSIAAEYGQSGLFGHADYFEAQKLGYSNEEIKNYLGSNPYMASAGNRPGQAGGLYEEIMRNNVNPQSVMSRGYEPAPASAPEPSYQINTSAGESADFFGDADYNAAKAAGRSDAEIKNFLDQNISGLLRGTHLPGGGGIYDRLNA